MDTPEGQGRREDTGKGWRPSRGKSRSTPDQGDDASEIIPGGNLKTLLFGRIWLFFWKDLWPNFWADWSPEWLDCALKTWVEV